jgi:hypothetical protein
VFHARGGLPCRKKGKIKGASLSVVKLHLSQQREDSFSDKSISLDIVFMGKWPIGYPIKNRTLYFQG